MFNTSELGHQIAVKISFACLLGAVGWVALLLHASAVVRDSVVTTVHNVSLGPLVLGTITKQVEGNSYSAVIAFESGLIWYVIICLGLGIFVGWLAAIRKKRDRP